MMRWIVGSSLKFRFLVIAIAAGMMYFGIGQLRQMPVDFRLDFRRERSRFDTKRNRLGQWSNLYQLRTHLISATEKHRPTLIKSYIRAVRVIRGPLTIDFT